MTTTTVAGEIRLKRVSPEYWRVTFDLHSSEHFRSG
jgi:hypothetical protein